jgi:prepilin-type N-terminal cleavage/methylation domain-containing protein
VTRSGSRLRLGPWARQARAGFTLIELLIGVAIIAILVSIAIPMLQSAQMRARYTRAGANARVVVTQAIAFAIANGVYPRGIVELRNSGYVSLPDQDPWNVDYQVCGALVNGGTLDSQGDIWACSLGPIHLGNCPDPTGSAIDVAGFPGTGMNGSVGFSSVYGPWTGF